MLSDADLMMNFESLGDNIEFGKIQRALGAEPLGLFRFNTVAIDNLCDALERRLDGLYEGDDLEILEPPGADQYFCRSRHYDDFTYQTLVSPRDVGVAAITARERKKIGFLKRRFLDDLDGGGKIFVRKGCDMAQDLRRLHRALSAYAPHVLLVVGVADLDHPAGTVEWLGERLLRGFVRGFKVCLRPDPFDVASWLEVCRRAYRMVHQNSRYARRARLASGSTWTVADHCEARQIGPPWRRRFAIGRGAAASDGPLVSSEVATVGVGSREMVLFSAWMRIPAGFAGFRVCAGFTNAAAKHSHPLDLARRACWQRTWVTAFVPTGAQSLTAAVYAEAIGGAPLEVAGWTFEKASAPSHFATGAPWHPIAWGAELGRKARSWLQAAEKETDATPEVFRRRAEALIARGAFVVADDLLSEALAAFPSDAGLAKLFALSAHDSGRYAGAIARWHTALTLSPKDPMCFAGFAANLREHRDLPRAWDVISSALQQFPDEMVVLTEAARIASMTQRPAEALRLWEKTIALHGYHPEWVLARKIAQSASLLNASSCVEPHIDHALGEPSFLSPSQKGERDATAR